MAWVGSTQSIIGKKKKELEKSANNWLLSTWCLLGSFLGLDCVSQRGSCSLTREQTEAGVTSPCTPVPHQGHPGEGTGMISSFFGGIRSDLRTHSTLFMTVCHAAAAKSLQSCPTLCNPIDSSPPGSPVPRILQARTLEWVAMSFSNRVS